MAENNTQQLPAFDSIDESINFFDDHDFGDYLEELPEVDFEIDLKRRTYVVTLEAELAIEFSKKAADCAGLSGFFSGKSLRSPRPPRFFR